MVPTSAISSEKVGFGRSSFFSSVAADLALRLGPDSERSGKIVCKKYEALWLQKTRQIRGEETTNKNQTPATTRKSPGQICVSPAEKAANQHKKGPEPHQKSPHQNHQDCLRHDRDKPTVSPKYAQNELASRWPKQKGDEKLCNCEKQQQKLLKATVHNGSHLRVLSRVLCLSSNKLVSFNGSGRCHKAWVYSPWEVAGIQGRALLCHQFLVVQSVALSSAVPRQDGTAGPDKEKASRARLPAYN